MVSLSAVIITYNEEVNIGRCLESLIDVADEIVIVDSFSTDRTEAICRQYPQVRFLQHRFHGYGEQKNYALRQTRFAHVLSLDADEALDADLQRAIQHVKTNWLYDGYTMNRLTNYCGHWIHHSGWYPDRKLRLWNKEKGDWSLDNLHEKVVLQIDTATGHLSGNLLHYSYYSIQEHVERSAKYANIAALALHQQGYKASWFHVILHPPIKFLRNYILKRGFLDGKIGYTICRLSARETYWKYRALRRLS